jgi:hypothetical protein
LYMNMLFNSWLNLLTPALEMIMFNFLTNKEIFYLFITQLRTHFASLIDIKVQELLVSEEFKSCVTSFPGECLNSLKSIYGRSFDFVKLKVNFLSSVTLQTLIRRQYKIYVSIYPVISNLHSKKHTSSVH